MLKRVPSLMGKLPGMVEITCVQAASKLESEANRARMVAEGENPGSGSK